MGQWLLFDDTYDTSILEGKGEGFATGCFDGYGFGITFRFMIPCAPEVADRPRPYILGFGWVRADS